MKNAKWVVLYQDFSVDWFTLHETRAEADKELEKFLERAKSQAACGLARNIDCWVVEIGSIEDAWPRSAFTKNLPGRR